MNAPARMIRHQQEGGFPTAGQVLTLFVAGTLVDPVRDRAALLVVGEHLREGGRVVLELARGRRERVSFRVFVEPDEACGHLLPILLGGEGVVLLLLELLEAHLLRGARVLEAGLDELVAGLALHVALVEVLVDATVLLQLLRHFAHRLHVGHGFEARVDGLLLVEHDGPLT